MRSTRTKICMLIPDYYPLVDRVAIQASGLLDRIDRDRFEPFVLTRLLPGTGCVDMSGNTPVIRIPAPARPATFAFAALRYLWKHRKEYDVIHVHSFDSPALAGALIKRILPGKKLVLTVPGSGAGVWGEGQTGTGRFWHRFILNMADAILPACREATKELQRSGLATGKITDIPNGVDTCRFSPAGSEEKRVLKRSFGIAEDTFVGIIVTRLIPGENVIDALEAWKRTTRSHPDSVLIVTGGGPEGPRVSAYATDALGERSVVFTGKATRDEIARLLRTADVYVDYSRSKGISNSTLEAMSAGLPVIAPEGPGNDEIVSHAKNGFLFDPTHPMDGADCILRLAEDAPLLASMSGQARRSAESQFSFERIARRIEDLYLGGRVQEPERVRVQAATGLSERRPDHETPPDEPGKHRRSKRRRRKKKRDRVHH